MAPRKRGGFGSASWPLASWPPLYTPTAGGRRCVSGLRRRFRPMPRSDDNPSAVDEHGHEDEHGHAHGDPNSVELSEQARKNIGLKVGAIELTEFERHLSIPGIVVERPGKSRLEVTAPFTGMVAEIHGTQGEAIRPGQELFDLRLTHEDVVQAQSESVRTAEELKVIRREVDRLKVATQDGAIARKSLRERQYEEQKQEAVFGTSARL